MIRAYQTSTLLPVETFLVKIDLKQVFVTCLVDQTIQERDHIIISVSHFDFGDINNHINVIFFFFKMFNLEPRNILYYIANVRLDKLVVLLFSNLKCIITCEVGSYHVTTPSFILIALESVQICS